MWPKWHDNKPFTIVVLVLLVFIAGFLWVKTAHVIKLTGQVGKPEPYEHTIYVDGQGKAIGKPDLATITVGVDSRAFDVASAQDTNTEIMNALLEKIKVLGIAEDDLQTAGYNAWQDCTWNEEEGYCMPSDWVVSQSVSIKVRDQSKISAVIETAGQNGATNVSGPSFTIDDQTALKAEAREEAIKDAMDKAKLLEGQLGVKIDRLVGYSEYTDQLYYPYYGMDSSYMGMAESAKAPDILTGTQDVVLNVSLTFKLVD